MNSTISKKQLKVAFHVYSFSFRGTENALFDYANKNETILNNKSIIVCPNKIDQINNLDVIIKFMNRFSIFLYSNYFHLVNILHREKVDGLYIIKYGTKDELSNYFDFNKITVPLLVHCVYKVDDPHGFIYAGVSESVVNRSKYEFVPHMITLMENKSPIVDLRKKLKISKEAIVFGRHGGLDTFNLTLSSKGNNISVNDVILKVLNDNPNIYFIFMPQPYILMNTKHPRIFYINPSIESVVKMSFINTCDAIIHAQILGESQGISILEFSVMNRPVITWNGGTLKQHLENLGDKAVLYNTMEELYNILVNFKKENYKNKDWNVTSKYNDVNVMKKFNQVFLEPLTKIFHIHEYKLLYNTFNFSNKYYINFSCINQFLIYILISLNKIIDYLYNSVVLFIY